MQAADDGHGATQGSVHLDALRGGAALLVFVNHTRALYFSSFLKNDRSSGGSLTALAAKPIRVGTEVDGELKVASAAVVIFFVLSGYLVGGSVVRSLRRSRWSWNDYLLKRLVRLLTVSIPAIVIGATLDLVGRKLFGYGSVYWAPTGIELGVSFDLMARLKPLVIVGNLGFLQNIAVPIEGTNLSLWSLANEFWYYLAFPLAAITLFPQYSKMVRGLSLLAAVAILWLVGFKIAILFPLWMMGTLVSAYPMKLTRPQSRLLSVVTVVALVGGVLGMRMLRLASTPAEYIIGVLTALLLYGLVAQSWPAKQGLYRKVSGFFSRISYSLYLFHLPVAVFLCGLINSPWRAKPKTWKTLCVFAATDLVVLGIVVVLWFAFEARTNVIRNRIMLANA